MRDSLPFVPVVQEVTKPDDVLRAFRVYFLFERQLPPESSDEPFAVEYEYVGENQYPHLGGHTEVSTVSSWQGDSEEMILAIAFPRLKLAHQ
jgi:hypothetical protein